jgi:hypothetical protein
VSTPEPVTDRQATLPALRRVIVLMLVNLGLSALLAVLIFAFRHQLVEFQLAQLPPGADTERMRAGLRAAVWARVAPVGLVAIVYFFLIKGLRNGSRRSYLRVVWLSAAGTVALGISLLTADPWWMRTVQAIQLVAVAALLYAVTRTEIRDGFPKAFVPAEKPRPRRGRPGDRFA